ncbi:pentapeptide repeat-containing protein [Streptomyces sp. NPDC006365]|uniref:pentapeptide repeat-containing protein n=1 Tax=Streptomyces sp. NPDC006365 TaxID=3364744 RepID=UPI00369979DB
MGEPHRSAYLDSLVPGSDIDHRGTSFTEALLDTLLNALRDSVTGECLLGAVRFNDAQFGDALFEGVTFSGTANFDGATFHGSADFAATTFCENARFVGTTCNGDADFTQTTFTGHAYFGGTTFRGSAQFAAATFILDALFNRVTFEGNAGFMEATVRGTADFNRAIFSRYAGFARATFEHAAGFEEANFSGSTMFDVARFKGATRFHRAVFSDVTRFDGATFTERVDFIGAHFDVVTNFGPLACGEHLDLSEAIFPEPVTLEIAARTVRCTRTRWESTATLRLRYASVDLTQAVLSFPMAVASHPAPFTFRNDHGEDQPLDESLLTGRSIPVRVTSVQGMDAAHLVLTDTDLTDCVFFGAFHIDQIRLEGRTIFRRPPAGIHSGPMWWTRRRTLAEEHHWRAVAADQPVLPIEQRPSSRAWRTGPYHPDPERSPDPEDVAALYRQLRKAFEDSKNEPGAADFYYGEMEMRRHDRTGTSAGERGLLWAYWLLSGYGLRASRALGWLALALIATIILMMGWGLPDSSPKQTATGTVPADGGRVALVVDKSEPDLTLPPSQRFTPERFDKAVRVVLNSVVFRSSGQDLTTVGTYTEMISRFAEPVLLGLAILAMRARIKR